MQELLFEAAPLVTGMLGLSTRSARASADPIPDTLALATIRNPATLETIARDWRDLESAPGSRTTPFQTFDFHRIWARHFASDDDLRVITVRERGRLVLILPLVVGRTPVGRVARWAGDPILQYGDVVAAPDGDVIPWLDAAFAELTRPGDISVLTLRRIRADAAIADWAARRLDAVGAAEKAMEIDLSGFTEPGDYARARSSRTARNRRRRNKLAQIGDVAFRMVDGGEEARKLARAALDLKRHWLEQQGQYSRALADPRTTACLVDMAAHEPADSGVVTASLEVGGRPAAVEIGMVHNGRYCAFLGAFDPALSKYSPGQVQMQDSIEWCIARRLGCYDLMAPADEYKRQLAGRAVSVQDYTGLLGLTGLPAAIWSTYAPRCAKAAFQILPRGLRNVIRTRIA
ncbi:CelD/BcsL family acetyltransferase involved in cellulose biosynthesis [Tepidamorphus gemmatus]|uniref:CelD/BcsL family acetyltransferase involved in cellulose biosynthesis n=1 Tax=Tepidamorphus gemmatus TaxID=747076 RepID=A0A4R3M0B6_9HYPH|nr:GNAT family N-acetyltransferase [Tepidamorphus gemmatus]TCT06450.1 CelD/BcsL family acetyltransferase involved in cellulose biosynthesis [Tepidamorphus gemmatus]